MRTTLYFCNRTTSYFDLSVQRWPTMDRGRLSMNWLLPFGPMITIRLWKLLEAGANPDVNMKTGFSGDNPMCLVTAIGNARIILICF